MPPSIAIYPLSPERLEPRRTSLFLNGLIRWLPMAAALLIPSTSFSIWYVVIAGLAFAGIISMTELPARRSAMVRLRPKPEEASLLCEGWTDSDRGYLYLTEKSLIYLRPGNSEKSWTAALLDIPLLGIHKTFGLFPSGISFIESGGKKRTLHVTDPDRWEERIQHARLLQVIEHETRQKLEAAI